MDKKKDKNSKIREKSSCRDTKLKLLSFTYHVTVYLEHKFETNRTINEFMTIFLMIFDIK